MSSEIPPPSQEAIHRAEMEYFSKKLDRREMTSEGAEDKKTSLRFHLFTKGETIDPRSDNYHTSRVLKLFKTKMRDVNLSLLDQIDCTLDDTGTILISIRPMYASAKTFLTPKEVKTLADTLNNAIIEYTEPAQTV